MCDLHRREPEYVKAGVHAEDWIFDAEVGSGECKPPCDPLLCGQPTGGHRQDGGNEPQQPPQNSARRKSPAATPVLASPQCQIPVGCEKSAHNEGRSDESNRPGDVPRRQRRLVANTFEPPPLDPESCR